MVSFTYSCGALGGILLTDTESEADAALPGPCLLYTSLPKYFSNTLILWIIGFVPQIIVSLLLAAWFTDLRRKLKGQTFFKTVIYMPNPVSYTHLMTSYGGIIRIR